MQLRQILPPQKTRVLLSVSFASDGEQKARNKPRTRYSCASQPFRELSKGKSMKRKVVTFRANANLARQLWGEPPRIALRALRDLTLRYSLSVAAGDVQFLDGRWYVTHSGLLQLASRKGCRGIRTILQERLSDVATGRWVFKATVFKSPSSKGFVGYGDADPSNVSLMVHGAEMRIAETRAVNRALRKAYGIGLCSVEELGSLSSTSGN